MMGAYPGLDGAFAVVDMAEFAKMKPPSVGVPTLFMYGEKKRTMYHTPDFLEKLDADEKSRWLSLPHGHWLYVQDTERCAAEMRAFLRES